MLAPYEFCCTQHYVQIYGLQKNVELSQIFTTQACIMFAPITSVE